MQALQQISSQSVFSYVCSLKQYPPQKNNLKNKIKPHSPCHWLSAGKTAVNDLCTPLTWRFAKLKEMLLQGQARMRTNGILQLFRFQEEFAGQLPIIACPEHI